MKAAVLFCLLACAFGGNARAQFKNEQATVGAGSQTTLHQGMRRLDYSSATGEPAEVQTNKRRDEQATAYALHKRMNAFVRAWNELVTDLNEGKLNVKKLRRVNKAWRDLEKSDSWLKGIADLDDPGSR